MTEKIFKNNATLCVNVNRNGTVLYTSYWNVNNQIIVCMYVTDYLFSLPQAKKKSTLAVADESVSKHSNTASAK